MALSRDEFVEVLLQSGVVGEQELSAVEESFGGDSPSTDMLLGELVKQKKLTSFQAESFQNGQHDSLVFGDYVVLDQIGQGGMGVVYKAMHRVMHRLVAVKRLPPQVMKSPAIVQRFYREVRAAAKLNHPNIVAAYDAGAVGDTHYLVMELVEGSDLSALVHRQGKLDVAQAVNYMAQAARGLAYAHEQGIIHRDIKPGNILVSNKGEVKLLDMGLARVEQAIEGAQVEQTITVEGRLMGTVEYMAPEQAADAHSADHRADVYALGCTLYRIVTSDLPYPGANAMQKLIAHREKDIPSMRDKVASVPQELDVIFQSMVAKSPDQRIQSMAMVADALDALVRDGIVEQWEQTVSELGAVDEGTVVSSSSVDPDAPTTGGQANVVTEIVDPDAETIVGKKVPGKLAEKKEPPAQRETSSREAQTSSDADADAVRSPMAPSEKAKKPQSPQQTKKPAKPAEPEQPNQPDEPNRVVTADGKSINISDLPVAKPSRKKKPPTTERPAKPSATPAPPKETSSPTPAAPVTSSSDPLASLAAEVSQAPDQPAASPPPAAKQPKKNKQPKQPKQARPSTKAKADKRPPATKSTTPASAAAAKKKKLIAAGASSAVLLIAILIAVLGGGDPAPSDPTKDSIPTKDANGKDASGTTKQVGNPNVTTPPPFSSNTLTPADGWFDVLSISESNTETGGTWTVENGELSGSTKMYRFPVELAGNHEIEIDFTMALKGGGFTMFSMADGQHTPYVEVIGSSGLNLHNSSANVTKLARADNLKPGQRYTLNYKRIDSDDTTTIDVTVDGKPWATWTGPTSKLRSTQAPTTPGIATPNRQLTVHGYRLRMLSGEAKLLRPQGVNPTPPKSNHALAFRGPSSNMFVEIPLDGVKRDAPQTIEAFVYLDPEFVPIQANFFVWAFSDNPSLDLWQTSGLKNRFWTFRAVRNGGGISRYSPYVGGRPGATHVAIVGATHVAIVWHEPENATLYVNGIGYPFAGGFGLAEDAQTRPELILGGKRIDGKVHGYFDGNLDELRFSSTARYDKNFIPPTPDTRYSPDEHTIALYHFDEGTGDVLKDSSGNNHHGKIVRAKWVKVDGDQQPASASLPNGWHQLPNGWIVGKPENLGPGINSESNDGAPFLTADGLLLLFHSKRVGGFGDNDLWMARRKSLDDPFGTPQNLGKGVNSTFEDGDPSMSSDGLTLFFNSRRGGGHGKRDLWKATRAAANEPFGNAVNLGPMVNGPREQSAPRLSADGRVLTFSSLRSGGQDWDLWMSKREELSKPFGKPTNLGRVVNSPHNDKDSSMSADGLTLLLASTRPGGQGVDDIYLSTRQSLDKPFEAPVNLGIPINSQWGDGAPALSADGKTLYFNSNRPGGQGHWDIWMVPIKRPSTVGTRDETDAPPSAVAPFLEPQAKAHQKAWADYLGVPVEKEVTLPGGKKMTFMLIPPGEFTMGTSDEERSRFIKAAKKIDHSLFIRTAGHEAPQHLVRITKPFYLGKTEFTYGQWGAGPNKNEPIDPARAQLPLMKSSWNDVQLLISQLNDSYDGNMKPFFLPTEAQWEYACRAGTTSSWHFGEDQSKLKEYAALTRGKIGWLHEVGGRKPNAWGLHDMHGNAIEWCADGWDENFYAKSPVNDPVSVVRKYNLVRVVRGGGHNMPPLYSRAGRRSPAVANTPISAVGFRLAMTIEAAKPKPATPAPAIAPFLEPEAKAHQKAWADHLGVPVEKEVTLPGGAKTTFMLIPPGEFTMGSSDAERARFLALSKERNDAVLEKVIGHEAPPHRVRITKPFYLGKTEFTQAQWDAVEKTNVQTDPAKAQMPARNKSVNGIQQRITQLNASIGGETKPFFLPTEAQWEYACRAGTESSWHFGEDLSKAKEYAWFAGTSGGKIREVGKKKPNPWGMHDMHGNVDEWCADGLDTKFYANSPKDDPFRPANTQYQVSRGGWYGALNFFARSASRSSNTRTHRSDVAGFRLAMTIEAAKPKPATPSSAIAPFLETEAKKHQKAWADYLGLPVEKEVALPGGKKMTFMLIPPGEFMMGSTKEEVEQFKADAEAKKDKDALRQIPSEGKQHLVRITKPFYLGKHEVTQAQWQAVMGNNPSSLKDSPAHPVEQVKYGEARQFVEKLSESDSANQARFSLPTEAQWEFACRAGTTTAWHCDDDKATIRKHGWFSPHAAGKTHPVGQLLPNPFGLYDMHGNVWEWCSDWFDEGYYGKSPVDDPVGPKQGELRVIRGGRFSHPASHGRSAFRGNTKGNYANNDLGFRVTMSIDITKSTPATPKLAVAPFLEPQAKAHQKAWADYLGLPVEKEVALPGGKKMTFMLIPPGEFTMGSSDEQTKRELEKLKASETMQLTFVPSEVGQRKVRITKAFYFAKTEVTQAQWQAVMGDNRSQFKGNPTHPVESVRWTDAQQFLVKLNKHTAADHALYSFPTEAQWEYACRAGTTTPWSWGDREEDARQYGWIKENAQNKSNPVGKLKPNPFGLYDMHGNVYEWCADWYAKDYYSKAPMNDPTGPAVGSMRVRRGGGWMYAAERARSARRSASELSHATGMSGFRPILTIDMTKVARSRANARALPEQLADLATGSWTPVFTSAEDIKDVKTAEATWNAGVVEISAAGYGDAASATAPRGRNMIVRAEINRVSGHAAILKLDRGGDRTFIEVKLVPGLFELSARNGKDKTNFEPVALPNSPTGFHDVALVTIEGDVALYIDGKLALKKQDVVPDVEHKIRIGAYNFDENPAKSQFRNVRVMLLDDPHSDVSAKPPSTSISAKDGWVDLLPTVQFPADAVAGDWEISQGALNVLRVEAKTNHAVTSFPIQLDGDYELKARTPKSSAMITFTLPVGAGRQVALRLVKERSGFERYQGRDLVHADNSTASEKWPTTAEPHDVTIQVKHSDSKKVHVVATVGGTTVIDWTGPASDLEVRDVWDVKRADSIGIGRFFPGPTVTSLQIRMLAGKGKLLRPLAKSPIAWDKLIGTKQALAQWKPREIDGHGRRAATAIAYSPDGSKLASVGTDGRLLIRRASDGLLIHAIETKSGSEVERALAFSTDGKWVGVSTFPNKRLRLFDVETGVSMKRNLGVCDSALAFSPDGKTLAALHIHPAAEIRVIDIESGQLRWSHKVSNAGGFGGRTVAYSPDGQLIAIGGGVSVTLRRADDGTEVARVRLELGVANSVAFSPDGKLIAAAADGNKAFLIDPIKKAVVAKITLPHHSNNIVTSVAFSPDGSMLAIGYTDKNVWLYNVKTRKRVGSLPGHKNRVTAVAFSPNKEQMASTSLDGKVIVWERTHATNDTKAPDTPNPPDLKAADGEIDLFPYIDPSAAGTKGRWRFNIPGKLISLSGARRDGGVSNRLTIPIAPKGAYELKIRYKKADFYRNFVTVMLPAFGRLTRLNLEGAENPLMFDPDWKTTDDSIPRHEKLRSYTQRELHVRVEKSGKEIQITATADGKPWFTWKGPPEAFRTTAADTDDRFLALGNAADVTFESATLRVLSDSATVETHPIVNRPSAIKSPPDYETIAIGTWEPVSLKELVAKDPASLQFKDGVLTLKRSSKGATAVALMDDSSADIMVRAEVRSLLPTACTLKANGYAAVFNADGRSAEIFSVIENKSKIISKRSLPALSLDWFELVLARRKGRVKMYVDGILVMDVEGVDKASSGIELRTKMGMAVRRLEIMHLDGKGASKTAAWDELLEDKAALAKWKPREVDGHGRKAASAIAYSPDGSRLASVGTDGRLLIRRASDGMLIHAIETKTGLAAGRALAFSTDGKWVGVSRNNDVWLFDMETGVRVKRVLGACDIGLAFSPDGKSLASLPVHPLAEIRVIDLESGQLRWSKRLPNMGSMGGRTVAYSPDGQLVATGGGLGAMLRHAKDGENAAWIPLPKGPGPVNSVVFSPDGKLLAVGADGTRAFLIDPAKKTVVAAIALPPHPGCIVNSVAFSPDGSMLMIGYSDKNVWLYNVKTRKLVGSLPGHKNRVTAVAFSPTGEQLASAGFDGKVIIWERTSTSTSKGAATESPPP